MNPGPAAPPKPPADFATVRTEAPVIATLRPLTVVVKTQRFASVGTSPPDPRQTLTRRDHPRYA